jgi:hypothetical protein
MLGWGGESGGGGARGSPAQVGGGGGRGGWYELLALKAFILSANEMPPIFIKRKTKYLPTSSAVTAG